MLAVAAGIRTLLLGDRSLVEGSLLEAVGRNMIVRTFRKVWIL